MTAFQGSAAALLLVLAMASHASPGATPTSAHPAHVQPSAAADRHFTLATRAFAHKAYKRAAHEIRLGDAYVTRQADRAAGATRGALKASASELSTLATSVQRGAVKDAHALDRAFDKARRALRAGASRQA